MTLQLILELAALPVIVEAAVAEVGEAVVLVEAALPLVVVLVEVELARLDY